MAKEAKGKKLKEIHIILHHAGHEGHLSDGFEVKHHFHSEDGHYEEPQHMGISDNHGNVMEHIHEHIKSHGESEDCDTCGNTETKDAKLNNISKHGYEKHTVNAPGHTKKHPGFKAVEKKIASKEGLSQKAAGAILASRTRSAGGAAHKANPRLNRVKG